VGRGRGGRITREMRDADGWPIFSVINGCDEMRWLRGLGLVLVCEAGGAGYSSAMGKGRRRPVRGDGGIVVGEIWGEWR
jgi:hypothetical protein